MSLLPLNDLGDDASVLWKRHLTFSVILSAAKNLTQAAQYSGRSARSFAGAQDDNEARLLLSVVWSIRQGDG